MFDKLTERRKADRTKMAAAVAALCAEMGATCEQSDGLEPQAIRVEITVGGARVGLDFDGSRFNSQPDVFCMPWNTVTMGTPLRMSSAFGCAVGASVNPYHRAKCMGFAEGFPALMTRLRAALECINSGEAFEPAMDAAA